MKILSSNYNSGYSILKHNQILKSKSNQNINFGEGESTDRLKGLDFQDTFDEERTAQKKSRARKNLKLKIFSPSRVVVALSMLTAAVAIFGNSAAGKIKNYFISNNFEKDYIDFARNILGKTAESDEFVYDNSDEIMVVQNKGGKNYIEIEKKGKDGTTVRYKVENPKDDSDVQFDLSYEDIKDISIGELMEQKKITQMGIDIDSDGNEEMSFEFANGDINNSTITYDFDSNGTTDKQIKIEVENFE